MISPDGINWAEKSTPSARAYCSICWSAELGIFVAINNANNLVLTSSNGINWTERTIPNSRTWNSVCWSAELGIFVAVNGASTNVVMVSKIA